MKAIKADLPRELKFIELHTFSDWHIGDTLCDMENIKAQIEAVNNSENAYVILNGDLMNNATKTSVSDCYAEVISPQRQVELLSQLLSPIREKIIMITQGNHEARTYRNDGIDLTQIVAGNLGLLNKYAREGGVCFLRFGANSKGYKETKKDGDEDARRKICYSIYATHGSGGGRKEGAKAIRLADMASIVDTDIYIHSHTHLPLCMKQQFYRINYPNSYVQAVEKLFVNTAAQLHYGGYGQTGEFKPSSRATPVILLSGTKKDMKVKM